MKIKYLKKLSVHDIFECQMCSQKGREQYIATPSLPSFADWDKLNICKKCAKREMGSRNTKEWKRMHEERTSG